MAGKCQEREAIEGFMDLEELDFNQLLSFSNPSHLEIICDCIFNGLLLRNQRKEQLERNLGFSLQ